VIQVQPGHAVARHRRGLPVATLGQHELAYPRLYRSHSNSAGTLLLLTPIGENSYYALGHHEAAIRDYSEAIQLNPEFAAAYNNRGNAYRLLGQYELCHQGL